MIYLLREKGTVLKLKKIRKFFYTEFILHQSGISFWSLPGREVKRDPKNKRFGDRRLYTQPNLDIFTWPCISSTVSEVGNTSKWIRV